LTGDCNKDSPDYGSKRLKVPAITNLVRLLLAATHFVVIEDYPKTRKRMIVTRAEDRLFSPQDHGSYVVIGL